MSAATVIRWAPCLLLEGAPLEEGITTSYPERLPGLFETSAQAMTAQAMTAAKAALRLRPDAIGCTARCMEVCQ